MYLSFFSIIIQYNIIYIHIYIIFNYIFICAIFCNFQIIFCLFVSFYTVLAENLTSISDSLAVETTIHTIKSPALLPPETKSKTEKRDSSDEIGE